MSGVLVHVEQLAGVPDRVSLEALAFARGTAVDFGGSVEVVVLGAGAREAATGLGDHGVSTAHVADDERLDAFAPSAWAAAIGDRVAARSPSLLVGPGTERGNEVLAHVAARAGLPMAANVTAIELDPAGGARLTRLRWAGSLLEDATLPGPLPIVTVAPHAIAVDERGGSPSAVLEAYAPVITDGDLRARVTGHEAPASGSVSLADARVVVGGGRGVGSAESFAALEELASLLGGAVGVSRAVTSAGWRPHAEQVGQTGLRIAPDLYIACGISGAIQHIVGCKAAKRILAINTDAEAPIMDRADYAVMGDLHAILPAINAEIRRATGR
jgi:electron transfer flavoprotein alpha subunit